MGVAKIWDESAGEWVAVLTGAGLSDATPQAPGTATAGVATLASRDDHVHDMPSAADVGADPAGTASSAVSTHVGAADPHGDRAYTDDEITALTASDVGAAGIWSVDHAGAFGEGFDFLASLDLAPIGALDWGDDYYFTQEPTGGSLTVQADEGDTIACVSYLDGAFADRTDLEGLWTLTGGEWVRDAVQPSAGEVVGVAQGDLPFWAQGVTFIKTPSGRLEFVNLQYVRAVIGLSSVIESVAGDGEDGATLSGAVLGTSLIDATSGPVARTAYDADSTVVGKTFVWVKTDSSTNAVTISPNTANTFNGSTDPIVLNSQWDSASATAIGTGEWVVTGRATTADIGALNAKAPLYLSGYADRTGATSASDGFRDAMDDLAAQGGGELVIDGTFLLDASSWAPGGAGASKNFNGLANHVVFTGYGSDSVLVLKGASSGIMMHLATLEMVTFRGVTFFGSEQSTSVASPTAVTPDCRKGIYLQGIRSAVFDGCYFVGIVAQTGGTTVASQGAVVHAYDTSLVMRSCVFAGCGGTIDNWGAVGYDTPVVRVSTFGGVSLDDCRFVDVLTGGAFKGTAQFFRRHPSAWVKVQDPFYTPGGMQGHTVRPVLIRNCHFDEGAASCIDIDGDGEQVRSVRIEGCNLSTPSATLMSNSANKAAPLLVTDADDVTVTDCFFGDFGTLTLAALFSACDSVLVDGAVGAAPVTTIEADGDCGTLVTRNLRGSLVTVTSAAATTENQTRGLAGKADAADLVWHVVDEVVVPAGDQGTVTFADLDEWAEVEIRWQGRAAQGVSSQVPLMFRLNSDVGANYNYAHTGRIVATDLLSNATGQTAAQAGYIVGEKSNTDRWSVGRISLRCDQPAASRKVVQAESSFGRSDGDEVGVAHTTVEWTDVAAAIASIILFSTADFREGSVFTLLGRK